MSLLIGYGIGMGICHVMGDADSGESIDKMKMLNGVFLL